MLTPHQIRLHPPRGHVRYAAPSLTLTAAALGTHLRLDSGQSTTEKDYLEGLIHAATVHIEDMTGIAIMAQKWTLTLDNWPAEMPYPQAILGGGVFVSMADSVQSYSIILPRFPLVTIDSIKVNGSAITTSTYFNIDIAQTPGRLVPKSTASLPVVTYDIGGIVIEYTAGPTTALPGLKHAVTLMASYLYVHRGDCETGNAFIDSGAKAACLPYMRKARI